MVKYAHRVALAVAIMVLLVGALIVVNSFYSSWQSTAVQKTLIRDAGGQYAEYHIVPSLLDFDSATLVQGCGVLIVGSCFLMWAARRSQESGEVD